MFYSIDMLIIKTNQPNTLVVTVSQNSELTNPEYLFSFTHIFSKQQVTFIPVDISTHKNRYDEFYFVEGSGPGEVYFPYQGQYIYAIYEQPAGSGNLNPSLATNVVENGEAQIYPSTAMTINNQYDMFISNNEDNSNIIFAPDEPNPIIASPTPSPTSSVTPTLTPTPSVTPTLTQTPSETPTLTPTNSETPTMTPTQTTTPSPTPSVGAVQTPLTLGATWWSQYSNSAFLNLTTPGPITPVRTYQGYINSVIDGVDGSTFFQNQNSAAWLNPAYSSCTPNFSGAMTYDAYISTAGPMSTQNGDYTGNTTDFTFFVRLNVNPRLFFTEEIINVSDTAYGQPVRWYQIKVPTFGGIEIDVWADPDTASGFLNINNGLAYNTWVDMAVRAYQDGPDYKIEYWTGNTIIASNSIVYTAIPTTAAPSQQIGSMLGSIAEASWWNRKLTDIEMGQMFTFLSNRYC